MTTLEDPGFDYRVIDVCLMGEGVDNRLGLRFLCFSAGGLRCAATVRSRASSSSSMPFDSTAIILNWSRPSLFPSFDGCSVYISFRLLAPPRISFDMQDRRYRPARRLETWQTNGIQIVIKVDHLPNQV